MKIIRGNRVYIQAKDIAILANSGLEVPQEIISSKFKDNDHTSLSRMNNLERYLCFESEAATIFFGRQDWIVNYDDIKNITLDECLSLLHKCLDDKKEVLSELNEIISEKTEAIIFDRINFLEHKSKQLKDVAICIINEGELPLPTELKPKKTVKEKLSGFMKKKDHKK